MTHDIQERIQASIPTLHALRQEIAKVVVGQQELIDRLLIGLFTKGHVLIEGVPGLAKTTLVKTLAATLQAGFKRIQFTPDLLPADILGTEIFEPSTGTFSIKKGPLFENIILADEINRAPSKVQSALLEAMQENQITIGDTTFTLPDPFLVMATQNPIEQEGTYPLPEAQVDRFMLKLRIDYPTREDEREIARRFAQGHPGTANPVLTPADLETIRTLIQDILLDDKLFDYIITLILATREPASFGLSDLKDLVAFGASPRATIYLTMAARAYAFLQGRAFVTPQDIKTIGPDVLRHRIILTYEAEAEDMTTDEVIAKMFASIEVP